VQEKKIQTIPMMKGRNGSAGSSKSTGRDQIKDYISALVAPKRTEA